MSHVPSHDGDSNRRRVRARVDASANVALEATGASVTSTDLDSLACEAGAWLRSLSASGSVHGLAERAPDIAKQLAASWDDSPSTALLLEQLLVDDGVQSLPPMITSELLRLYEYHTRCRDADAPHTTGKLSVSGLQDLQPTAASHRGHP